MARVGFDDAAKLTCWIKLGVRLIEEGMVSKEDEAVPSTEGLTGARFEFGVETFWDIDGAGGVGCQYVFAANGCVEKLLG